MGTFQYNDHSRFFGRDHYVQELVERLRLHPFLTIIGPSGSGKSSLVFAGLVPALRKSTHFLGSGEWLAWWLRPGEAPLAAEATPIGDNPAQRNQTVPALLTMQSNTKHVLLIVDQFEEVFTVTRVDAVPFQKALLQLAQKPHCYVVLTARADFYQDLMTSLLWPEIQAHRAEVLPLDNDGLRQAIVQPAEDVGVFVESALVERLVADAAGEPGIMPFIQETLVLLWERLERRFLSLTAYAALVLSHSAYGAAADIKRTGLQVAMARRAYAALAALTPAQQAIARRIFVRLVQFGEGRADTRRQQPVTALRSDSDEELFEQTLSHLTDKRLLTLSGAETGPGRKVDIAHEALISGWSTLRQLLNKRRIAEQTRRRLEDKADEWVRLGRGSGGLLDAAELPEAERWLCSPDAIDLGYAEALSALVLASRTAIERAEQAQARVNKLLRRGTLALGILLMIAVGFAWYAWHQKGKAQTNEKIAKQAQQRAERQRQIALARQLAAQSRNQPKGRFDLSLLLSLESNRLADTVEGKSSLLDGLQLHPYLTTFLHGHVGSVRSVAFSFDGKMLAAGSEGNLLLWDMATRRQLGAPLAVDEGPVHGVAFSPDGRILASISSNGTIRLWDMATRQPLGAPLTGHTAPVRQIAFSRMALT